MTKITLEYFGMPGEGATVKEAKADAGRRIQEALAGDYTPVAYIWRNTIAIMARNPQTGWGYRLLHPDLPSETRFKKPLYLNSYIGTKEDCERSLVMHIADIERLPGERDSELFDVLKYRDASACRKEFAERAKRDDEFQFRARYAKDNLGMTEAEAYHFAHRAPGCEHLWRNVEVPLPEYCQ